MNKEFKYEVKVKTAIGIISTINGKYIVGGEGPWLKCDEDTTLNNIKIIKPQLENQLIKTQTSTQDEKTYTFTSSSSDSVYTVKLINDTYNCDCPGFWRSKGNCKHIKELKNEN